jgi:hypothetical protein
MDTVQGTSGLYIQFCKGKFANCYSRSIAIEEEKSLSQEIERAFTVHVSKEKVAMKGWGDRDEAGGGSGIVPTVL